MFGNSPFNQTAPKPAPKKPATPYRNPLEMVTEEAKAAGKTIAEVPKDIMQSGVDNMWAAIYGAKPQHIEDNPMKEQAQKNASTKLDFARLELAWKQQDQKAAEHWQQKLNTDLETAQLNQAAHSAMMAESERAAQELEMEEQERKKKIEEGEMMKKQQEEEERAANMSMSGDGAAKSKGGPGGGRKKASTDDTNFEASKGRTGK